MATIEAESLVRDWLATRFPDARLCTETPSDLASVLPCIRVARFGGGRESFPAFDQPNLDIDVFHSSRILARALAYEVGDAILFELNGNDAVLRATEFSGPSKAPWDNTNVVRFTAAYSLRIHSPF